MIKKSDLIADVAQETGETKATSKKVVDALFTAISANLASSEKVQVSGFGSFESKQTKARTGRNPATGEPIHIPAGRKVAFKPAPHLKGEL